MSALLASALCNAPKAARRSLTPWFALHPPRVTRRVPSVTPATCHVPRAAGHVSTLLADAVIGTLTGSAVLGYSCCCLLPIIGGQGPVEL